MVALLFSEQLTMHSDPAKLVEGIAGGSRRGAELLGFVTLGSVGSGECHDRLLSK
jgi:hypothetical protein